MPDCSATGIKIGGTIACREYLENLALAIKESGTGIEWEGGFESIAEVYEAIAEAVKANEPLILLDNKAPGGRFEDLETTCRHFGLSFVRADDGHYTWSPGVEFYDAESQKTYEWIGTVDDNVPHISALHIRGLLANGGLEEHLKLMERADDFKLPLQLAEGVTIPVSVKDDEPEGSEAGQPQDVAGEMLSALKEVLSWSDGGFDTVSFDDEMDNGMTREEYLRDLIQRAGG